MDPDKNPGELLEKYFETRSDDDLHHFLKAVGEYILFHQGVIFGANSLTVQECEDLGQIVLNRLCRRISKLIPAKVNGLIFTMARQEAHKMSLEKSRAILESLDNAEELHDKSPLPDALAIQEDQISQLIMLLEMLPEREKSVLAAFTQGQSVKEIAKETGIAPDEVSRVKYDAIGHIRELWGE